MTKILTANTIPKIWRKAKVITIPKPGKDPNLAASYRPISLLSVCYKLSERLILRRISLTVEALLNPDQAGFRSNHSTCDQVAALSTYIENGFQRNMKTGAVFLDLTTAYDTVWHNGLLARLSRSLLHRFCRLIEVLLRDRRFSAWRTHRLCLGINTVQSVHKRSAQHTEPQIHLR